MYPAEASDNVRTTIDNGFTVVYKKLHEETRMDECLIERTYAFLEPSHAADLGERMLIYPAPT